MNKSALFHRANSNYSYITEDKDITLLFRTSNEDELKISVVEYNRFDGLSSKRIHPMSILSKDQEFHYYHTTFEPVNGGAVYFFEICENEELPPMYYSEYGLSSIEPERVGSYEIPSIEALGKQSPPNWLKDAVAYQIFPDRFSRKRDSDIVYEKWENEPTYYSKFGGNIKGIIAEIPYLQSLGVNLVYLTPVAYSKSPHRYDTIDYMKIDPVLGSSETFRTMVEELHKKGIRVVLDAVFNHCSSDFFAFQDVLTNQRRSKYKDWFFIDSYPVSLTQEKTYRTYAFERNMPKLNTKNPEVRAYLLSVARHYMNEFHIDGWRLDVADEVDHEFWRLFRAEVKRLNPEAVIIGEIWHNPEVYLRGDLFDSVQNYQFYELVQRFFVRKQVSIEEWIDSLTTLQQMIPLEYTKGLLNALGTHDTPRIFTSLDHEIKRLKLALLFQFFFPGVPTIYYGDEIGMSGGKDPDNRRCFPWKIEKWNQNILEFFKALIQLHRNNPVMTQGIFRVQKTDAGLLMFERKLEQKRFQVFANPFDYTVGGMNAYAFQVIAYQNEISNIIIQEEYIECMLSSPELPVESEEISQES